MPAASSAASVSPVQALSPNESRIEGSGMPAPSSVTVTRYRRSDTNSPRTEIAVAPARRAFCKSSTKASSRVALKKRLTRSIALSWTRAWMVDG